MDKGVSSAGSSSSANSLAKTVMDSSSQSNASKWSGSFGLNTAEAARDIRSLDRANRDAVMNAFTPVEQGQLLRAMDGLKNPRPLDMDCARGASRSPSSILAGRPTASAPDPMGVSRIFGADAAALIAKSPSLTRDLQALQNDGWTIVTATSGGSFCNKSTKTITIDTADNNTPALLTQVIAHEVGHARYTASVDTSSRAAFVRTNLADEGAATLANIRVQREIIANGGADIGIAGNSANHAGYNAAYDAFVAGGSEADARDAIGAIFGNGERTSNTNESYTDYYGGFYDRNYGTTPTP
jgi:hypothetical protein